MHQMIIIFALLTSPASAGEFARAAEQDVPVQLDWPSSGHNNQNTRYVATEHIIDADNVGRLKPKWTFTTTSDVSATATVVNEAACVADWGGKLRAVDTKAGEAQCTGAAIDGAADGFGRRMG